MGFPLFYLLSKYMCVCVCVPVCVSVYSGDADNLIVATRKQNPSQRCR